MLMDLKEPCPECPFRNDTPSYLTQHRAKQFSKALLNDQTFTCHKYCHSLGLDKTKEERHCAGALILLEKLNRPNQWMRWMERLQMYDRTKLNMDAPVFNSFEEFIEAQD